MRSATVPGEPSDSGQIAVLVLSLVAIASALILVVAAASGVHLQRKRLLALADAAALHAASGVSEQAYATEGVRPGGGVPLTDDTVLAATRDYLDLTLPRLTEQEIDVVAPTGAPGGHTAEVTLQRRVQVPFVQWLAPRVDPAIVIRVTARADVSLR